MDSLARRRLATRAFRNVALGYEALSGEGARVQGGRWNPPESFPVIYSALSLDVSVGELQRTASRQGRTVDELMPRRIVEIEVELQRVLDLAQADNLAVLGVTPDLILGDDLRLTQAIGEAAHYVGFEAILAPSAARSGLALAIYPLRRLRGSSVAVVTDQVVWAIKGSVIEQIEHMTKRLR